MATARIRRRTLLKAVGLGGVAVAFPNALAACGSDDASSSAASASGKALKDEIDSLTWAVEARPAGLDIASSFGIGTQETLAPALEGLVHFADDLSVQPLLAEKWEQPDISTYVFTIRSGVTFWDGSPLTAEDVAYSLSRHLDPKLASQLAAFYGSVKSIEATGDREVTVKMKEPEPDFLGLLAFSYITPKAFSERLGKRLGTPGSEVRTMGTGAYEITSYDAEQGVTYERRDDYWGPKPLVRKLSVRFIPNPQNRRLAQQSGELDGSFGVPIDSSTREWERLRSVASTFTPGFRVAFMILNTAAAPYDDVHVRRAIAHATDRDGYVKSLVGGHGKVAHSIVPPEQFSNLASEEQIGEIFGAIPKYPFDLDRAKAELAKSAHPKGFKARVPFPTIHPVLGKALVSLSENLKQLNIELEVEEVTENKWAATFFKHKDIGMQVLLIGTDGVDPSGLLKAFHLSRNARPAAYNLADFKDARVDRLLLAQSNTTDAKARVRDLAEVLRIGGEQLPYLPLWWPETGVAVNKKLVYNGYHGLYAASNWVGNIALRA